MQNPPMKYGVNLYPERAARRAAGRASVRRGVRLGVIAGLGTLLVATEILSGALLRERAERLERRLAALPEPVPSPAASGSRTAESSDALGDRVVWFPKLAAVARTIPDEMFLTEIAGAAREAGRPDRRLDITGHIAGENPELIPALGMAEALKWQPAFAADFPVVEVHTARGTRLVTVEISCRAGGAGGEGGDR